MQEQQITFDEFSAMNDGAPEYDQSQYDQCDNDMSDDYFYRDYDDALLPAAGTEQVKPVNSKKSQWYSNYVMDESGNYVEIDSKSKLTRAAFDNRFYSMMPVDDKGKKPRPSSLCLGLIPTIERREYSPDLPSVYTYSGMTVLNTYKHTYMEFEGDHSEAMSIIKTHLNRLLRNEQTESLILDWMAWNVQHTGKIKHFAPIIVGKFGDGKSTIAVILRRALGSGNVNEISNSAISSNFTAWANSSAVGSIEELKLNGIAKYETYNKLKPFITNEEIEIINKGKDGITVKNTTNYIAFTNYRDAIPIEEGDRRYWVINTHYLNSDLDIGGAEYKSYFTNLYSKINNDTGQFRSALLGHVISDTFLDMNAAPNSDAKKQMQLESMSAGAHALRERIEYHGNTVIEDGWINVSKIRSLEGMNPFGFDYDKIPTGKSLEFSMRELGYKNKTRQTGGKRNTLYK